MNNNDFLAAIEKAKKKLTDENYSKDDLWFSGSLAMLEACLVELWNTAKKDTIPIEWIEKWKSGKTSIEQVVADKIMMDYKYKDWWEEHD